MAPFLSNQDHVRSRLAITVTGLVGLLICMGTLSILAATPPPEIRVPYVGTPPIVDGVCKTEEYAHASAARMTPYSFVNDKTFLNNTKAILMVEHDDARFYGCLDWPSQKEILRAHIFQVILDTEHNGIYEGKIGPDDLDFSVGITNVLGSKIYYEKFSYYGTPLDKFAANASLSQSPNDPTSRKSAQWEFAIPMELIGKYSNPSNPNLIGFFAESGALNNGVAYPIMWALNAKSVPLADVTFLPQVRTTTTLATLSTRTIATTTATSTRGVSKTSIATIPPLSLGSVWFALVASTLFLLTILVYRYHRKHS